jgi:hypothetical protein
MSFVSLTNTDSKISFNYITGNGVLMANNGEIITTDDGITPEELEEKLNSIDNLNSEIETLRGEVETIETTIANIEGGSITVMNSQNSQTINVTTDNTSGTYFIPFSKTFGTGDKALFQDDTTGPLTYNPSTATLTATNITGNISGSISVTNNSTNNVFYPVFVQNNASGIKPLLQDGLTSTLTYNPGASVLTSLTFSGALSGNATTATDASNAEAVLITSDNTSGTYFIPFSKTIGTGDKALFQDDSTTPLTYDPSTGTLTATTFNGAVSGTISNAANAVNVGVTANSTNAEFFPTFVSATSGNLPEQVDADLTYNPSTNTLTATNFVGSLTGNASTATTATDASNADNVLITSDNTDGSYFIPFSKTSGTGDKPLFQDDTTGPLTYNPATATLTCTNINGNATTSGSSGSVLVTSDNTNGTYYIPFSKTSGSGSKSLFQDDTDTAGPLTYNPSTRQLTVSRLTPNAADVNASLTFVERCFIRRINQFGASMGNSNFQATGQTDYAVYMGNNGENNINAPAANLTYPIAKLNLKIGDVAYMTVDGNASRLGNIGIRTIEPFEPLDVFGNIRSSTSVLTPEVGNPSGNLNIRVNNQGTGGTLSFTGGTGLLSATAGGTSGQHLSVTINGTAYKIALLNP